MHLESLTYERDGLVLRAQVGHALRPQGRGAVPIHAPQVLQLVDDGSSVWVQTEAEHVWDAWFVVAPEDIRERSIFDDEPTAVDAAAS